MQYYEILFEENSIYYVNFYENGYDVKPVKLRLTKDEFEKFKKDKLEK